MKHSPSSLVLLVTLATPLAACIAIPPEDCPYCKDPSCPTSPTSSSSPGATPATRSAADAAPAAPVGKGDAGTDRPALLPEPDAGTPQTPCTDAGTCGRPVVPLCTWNHECGTGGRCADGECQRPCTGTSVCGTGDTCQAGFCQPGGSSGGQCVYAGECNSGSLCINGFCHAGCKMDGDCPNRADACTGGVCQPDGRPTPQCRSNRDCATDRECVNATCRTLCDSDANCGAACSGTLCREGYCVEAQELSPQCSRNATCVAGHACVDAICL